MRYADTYTLPCPNLCSYCSADISHRAPSAKYCNIFCKRKALTRRKLIERIESGESRIRLRDGKKVCIECDKIIDDRASTAFRCEECQLDVDRIKRGIYASTHTQTEQAKENKRIYQRQYWVDTKADPAAHEAHKRYARNRARRKRLLMSPSEKAAMALYYRLYRRRKRAEKKRLEKNTRGALTNPRVNAITAQESSEPNISGSIT